MWRARARLTSGGQKPTQTNRSHAITRWLCSNKQPNYLFEAFGSVAACLWSLACGKLARRRIPFKMHALSRGYPTQLALDSLRGTVAILVSSVELTSCNERVREAEYNWRRDRELIV